MDQERVCATDSKIQERPMTPPQSTTAAVLIIGNEILSGRTGDANLRHIATQLAALGVRLCEARVVRDDEAAIVAAVNALRAAYDYVFTTGGIGPTHDDITSAAVAKAFGVKLERNPAAEQRLLRHYRPEDLNPARLRMADLPVGATLIDNPISQAPGIRVGNVFVLAGVPRIMQAMFDALRPLLEGGAPLLSHALGLYVAEGVIAAGLGAVQARHDDVEIGSYPFYRRDRLGTVIVARGTDRAVLAAAIAEVRSLAESLGAEIGEEEPPE